MGEKILIVEDDRIFLETMKFKLENEGYQVLKAEDAGEALCAVEQNKIDLIISDIMMPNISGLSLLSILHEFYSNKVPVIIISSLSHEDIIMSAIGLGVSDFLTKPVNFGELCVKITLLLNKNNMLNLKNKNHENI